MFDKQKYLRPTLLALSLSGALTLVACGGDDDAAAVALGHREQRGGRLLYLVKRTGERLLRDIRVIAEDKQGLALALEFLDQIHLEVGAAGNFKNFEEGEQRDVVLASTVLLDKIGRLVEQILQAQQGAYALIERIFVCDHAAASSENGKFPAF